jgi:hypothetical protein
MSTSTPPTDLTPSEALNYYNFFLREGFPFSWKDREYLKAIYDIPFRTLFLMKGRQVEGSTMIANQILIPTVLKGPHNSLYLTPSVPQTKLFSLITLKEILASSPYAAHCHYSSQDTIKNVYHKSFTNGSHIFFRYANIQTVERLRGIPSINLIAVDEIQDMLIDILPIVYETQSHVQEKKRILTGTPKSFAHPTEYFWQKSQKIEWVVKCEHCNHHNILTDTNIGKKGLICSKCGKRIYARNGQWIKTNPTAKTVGFRLHQLMCPFLNWDDLLEKRDSGQYTDSAFKNEVLALSTDSANRGLTPRALQKACRPYHLCTDLVPEWEAGYRFGGVDWGLGEISFIVHKIFAMKAGKLYLIYAKRYKGSEAELLTACDNIIKTTIRFKVTLTFADFGFGAGLNERIKEKIEDFAQVQFCTCDTMIKWRRRPQRYQADRTTCITNFFEDIRKEKIFFPNWSEFETFGQDILNEYIEYDEQKHVVKYVHNKPDDALFAAIYAWLAYRAVEGRS